MGFQQLAEPENRAPIGQVVFAGIHTPELTEQHHVAQSFIYGRIREAEPLLQEVDA